ncbi:hypothetical protein TNCV_3674541 [Trichonephila clavipes]|nr:hypothetical protein TNCV_3674541 [Trichonephila clavipes]
MQNRIKYLSFSVRTVGKRFSFTWLRTAGQRCRLQNSSPNFIEDPAYKGIDARNMLGLSLRKIGRGAVILNGLLYFNDYERRNTYIEMWLTTPHSLLDITAVTKP